jgi:hypothetical protein
LERKGIGSDESISFSGQGVFVFVLPEGEEVEREEAERALSHLYPHE